MTQGYKSLKVYQLAFEAAKEIFRISKSFPAEEKYSLTDQIKRSSRSVCTCIGEGYRKRKYPNYFSLKMTDADGEATETSIWIDFALSSEYIDNETHAKMMKLYDEIGRMLSSMSENPEKFIPRNNE